MPQVRSVTAVCPSPLVAPRRIVVAEDDPDMREMVVQALRGDGYEVLEVADGRGLLHYVEMMLFEDKGIVDLIVSDVRMPGCTGLELLSALRAIDRSTPVIMMTAFGSKELRARVEELDAVLFDKPFELDDLRTAVLHLAPRR